MSASLNREELDIVRALRDVGISLPVATLAVVMITRDHARPENELADIVRQYQNLEDRSVAAEAIAELKRRNWLVISKSYGQELIHQSPDLKEKLAQEIGDPILPDKLLKLCSSLEPCIRILGSMNDRSIYGSYLDLLSAAQREICLPMLATSPHISSVSILQERARKGVRVRILLGSPAVVTKLRGETFTAMAHYAIAGWIKNSKHVPRMEVKVVHRFEDMLAATSMTIDGKLLRFDVYDPTKQRSLEGVMLEVESPVGIHLNLMTLFQSYFDEAWHRAEPTHLLGKLWWWFARGWQWWAFIVSTVITFVLKDSFWAGIAGSVASTFLINAVVVSWPVIHSFIRRLLDD